MTAHGFRAPASSILNESGSWNPDATEAQLAHVDTNATRGLRASAVLGGAHSDDALAGGGLTGRIQVRCCLTVANRSRANRAEARLSYDFSRREGEKDRWERVAALSSAARVGSGVR